MPASRRTPAERLPTYKLYGEHPPSSAIDWLHCESISSRSRLHNWEIRPHRHEVLAQLLHLERGRAEVQLDGAALPLAGPGLVVVPALVAHGFRFSPDTQGTVVTVNEAHLGRLLAGEPRLGSTLARPAVLQLRRRQPQAAALAAAVQPLRDEFLGRAEWRTTALDAALLRLAIAAARALALSHAQSDAAPAGARASGHVERYRALVEQLYRQQPALADIAARLGITPTQLNRICRQRLGHTALAGLQDRIVLEAKRELTYTSLSIKQIAHELGFGDAAYFTRFFQRETGLTPTGWRAQAAA